MIAYVVTNGDPAKVSDFAIKLFLDELHKEVSLDYAQKKIIYSEHFIRYHEKRGKEVSKAIHKLFELYGYAQTKYDLKKNGIPVIDIQRARIRMNDAEIHIKTYRPKKYNVPAISLWDHPKIEATAYFTKSKNGQERIREIEHLARDLIATIVEFTEQLQQLSLQTERKYFWPRKPTRLLSIV